MSPVNNRPHPRVAPLSRKRLEQLQGEGVARQSELMETYREASQAFAQLLLAALRRCRSFSAYAPVIIDDGPPQCGCADCYATRATMTTHLRSIAVMRAAMDAFVVKAAAKTGRTIRPVEP